MRQEREDRELWELELSVRVNAVGMFPAAMGAINHAEALAVSEFERRRPLVEQLEPERELDGIRPAERLPQDPEIKRARGYVVRMRLREEIVGGQRQGRLEPLYVELSEEPEPFERPDAWGGWGSDVAKIKEETRAIWERKALDAEASGGSSAPKRSAAL